MVEGVTYQNAEFLFCVIRVKARGHRDLVTVVGHAAVISAGEWITASGDWTNDRIHGQQFKARFLKTSAPTSLDGIEKYLASGMIRGIGPEIGVRPSLAIHVLRTPLDRHGRRRRAAELERATAAKEPDWRAVTDLAHALRPMKRKAIRAMRTPPVAEVLTAHNSPWRPPSPRGPAKVVTFAFGPRSKGGGSFSMMMNWASCAWSSRYR
jgi:hypothetical protein